MSVVQTGKDCKSAPPSGTCFTSKNPYTCSSWTRAQFSLCKHHVQGRDGFLYKQIFANLTPPVIVIDESSTRVCANIDNEGTCVLGYIAVLTIPNWIPILYSPYPRAQRKTEARPGKKCVVTLTMFFVGSLDIYNWHTVQWCLCAAASSLPQVHFPVLRHYKHNECI